MQNQNQTLKPYRVMLHEDPGDKLKIAFDCHAEDEDHAVEQAENAYPGCAIVHALQLDETTQGADNRFDCYVCVTGEASNPDDEAVPGIYLVQVQTREWVDLENLPTEQAHFITQAVLNEFHEKNGIEVLDDFSISVYLANGQEISEMADVSSSEFDVDVNYIGAVDVSALPDALLDLADEDEVHKMLASRVALATQFMDELHNSVEALIQIVEIHGAQTMVDLMWLQHAILTDGSILVDPQASRVSVVADNLPSGHIWSDYIEE